LLALYAACPAACGPAEPAARPAGLALRPGDTLLDHLDALVVERAGDGAMEPVASARAGEILGRRVVPIDPSEWRPTTARLKRASDVPAWEVRPGWRLDLGLGAPWLEHEGRRIPRSGSPLQDAGGVGATAAWRDPEGRVFFRWAGERGVLTAYRTERPGKVLFGYSVGSHDLLARIGERLLPGSPLRASDLACRATLDGLHRPALLLPAPGALRVDLAELAADELRLALGVADVAFAVEDGVLRRVPSPSDGVTFVVEVETSDGRMERLAAQHVAVLDRFEDARIDLRRFRGRSLRLMLSTEPGPATDASADFALVGELRLTGGTTRAPTRPHVVLVDIDTLRADRLGVYGCERETSPRIDAWAERCAVVFTDAVSAGNWTLPSTASILTGLLVSQHGVSDFAQRVSAQVEPVALRLRRAGYETVARTDGGWVSPDYGFAIGFDRFDARRIPPDEHQARGWAAELAELSGRDSERPVFAFFHTFQVHAPYAHDRRFEDPAHPYDGHYARAEQVNVLLPSSRHPDRYRPNEADWRYVRDLYDAAVRRMDDVVGPLLEGLDATFSGQPYLVILTSDHGEELDDRGRFGHGHSLHGELLDVPMIVRFPTGSPVGRDDRPVSSLDVVPTILAAAGLAVPDHLLGRPLSEPAPERRLRIAEHGTSAAALLVDRWKLLAGAADPLYLVPDRFPSLFDVPADPAERVDRAADEPDRVRELTELLERVLAQHPRVAPDSPVTRAPAPRVLQELRELGYVGDE